ncbi:MAG: hypothetical protein P8Y03_05155 [Anaerolineales bacterium]
MKRLTILLILEILLVACNAPRPVNTPTALLNANPAPISTSTPTKIPTDTPTLIPSPSPSPSPTPAYPQEGYGPSDFPPNINPLTGLSVTNASLLQRRPLAIKVNIVPLTASSLMAARITGLTPACCILTTVTGLSSRGA